MARFCGCFEVNTGFPSSNSANREQQSDEFGIDVYSRSSSKEAVGQNDDHESDHNSDKGKGSSSKEDADQDENENESDNNSDEGDLKKSEEHGDSSSLCEPAEFSFESLLESPLVSNARPYSTLQRNSNHNSCTKDGLRLCTESLGFESSDERENSGINYVESSYSQEDAEFNNENDENDYRRELASVTASGATARDGGIGRAPGHVGSKKWGPGASFPPPLSSMAPDGQPSVFLKPLRIDGRFLLHEMKLPRHERLHAWRQDGRLRLQLVPSSGKASSSARDAVVEKVDVCGQGIDTSTSSMGDGEKWVASLEEERVHVDFFRPGADADASLALYQETMGRRCQDNTKRMTSTWKPRCITT